ncbi:hypothetical protein K8F61_10230 [Microbacterium resistens]|uniref:Uncharacterized protein n=1 Tax=Microbacterium resistens TaxID=156977 RepID=A0ABY3RMX8_9MICO|nr:hypothetical protein [Microbacterium resistens]UGS25082.1 hypothetical protein K8F61_10230 [Microbacterium resistens]
MTTTLSIHRSQEGADTALVKGRVGTPAPILARAGFRRFGEERSYSIRL